MFEKLKLKLKWKRARRKVAERAVDVIDRELFSSLVDGAFGNLNEEKYKRHQYRANRLIRMCRKIKHTEIWSRYSAESYNRSLNICKTIEFKNSRLYFNISSGVNCEDAIGIKYQYYKYRKYWDFILMLWFIDIRIIYHFKR